MSSRVGLDIPRPAFFACDIQERFRSAIYQFPSMAATSRRLVEFARVRGFSLSINVLYLFEAFIKAV